jgi:hypothetical protein
MMLPELSKAVTFTLLAIKASYYLSLCFTSQLKAHLYKEHANDFS